MNGIYDRSYDGTTEEKPANLLAPNMDAFMAQLLEHHIGNAKLMGSIPVED